MSVVLAVAGVVLVALAVVDSLWTTLWVEGAGGPVTSRVNHWIWRAALRLFPGRQRVLNRLGPLILIGTVVSWVGLLWAGWVFVFASDPSSLIDTRQPGHADWVGRIWYVAYAEFTMGNGDFTPGGGLWQLVSSLVNASGMFLVTLAITYLLSVLSAVTAKRGFASSVHGLGETGQQVVLAGWNGHDLHSLDLQLSSLSDQLTQLSEQYLAYPVLHYYHPANPQKSLPKAVAVLDDALTLMAFGVDERARPGRGTLSAARASIATFLQTLDSGFVAVPAQPPPRPLLQPLRKAGVPTIEDHQFIAAVDELDHRRRRVLGLVRSDGWSMPAPAGMDAQ